MLRKRELGVLVELLRLNRPLSVLGVGVGLGLVEDDEEEEEEEEATGRSTLPRRMLKNSLICCVFKV